MNDQQIFERAQSQYHNFDHIHDYDPDDIQLGLGQDKTTIVVNVHPEGREDNDAFQGDAHPFSPGPWSGKTLINEYHHGKHRFHEKDCDQVGGSESEAARTDFGKWKDVYDHGDSSINEEEDEPDSATDSNRHNKDRMYSTTFPHAEEAGGGMSHADQLYSTYKLTDDHRLGCDNLSQEAKARQSKQRYDSPFNSHDNNHLINPNLNPKDEVTLARMLTNLQSPRPRASRTVSLLHRILKSSRTRTDTASRKEHIQAMECMPRWTRVAKGCQIGSTHGGHCSNNSNSSSSAPSRHRATTCMPTYVIRDTPFYGIENLDMSPAQCHEIRSRRDPHNTAVCLSIEGKHGQYLKSKGKNLSKHVELHDHREHIWAIAHEHKYGLASASSGASGVLSPFENRRYKRFSRLVPMPDGSDHLIPQTTMVRSGVQMHVADAGLQEEEKEHPPRAETSTYALIPIPPGKESRVTEDRSQPLPPLVAPCPASVRASPVSRDIYGPESFAESLQCSTVEQSQQAQHRVKEDRRQACLAKWKKWLFLLMALLVVLVVVVVLLVPKKGGGSTGGGQGGNEVYLGNGQDVHDEGKHGVKTQNTTTTTSRNQAYSENSGGAVNERHQYYAQHN